LFAKKKIQQAYICLRNFGRLVRVEPFLEDD